jgi:hypothetical protein
MGGDHLALDRLVLVVELLVAGGEGRPGDVDVGFEGDDVLEDFNGFDVVLIDVEHIAVAEEVLDFGREDGFATTSSLRTKEGNAGTASASDARVREETRKRNTFLRFLLNPLAARMSSMNSASASPFSGASSHSCLGGRIPSTLVPLLMDVTKRLQHHPTPHQISYASKHSRASYEGTYLKSAASSSSSNSSSSSGAAASLAFPLPFPPPCFHFDGPASPILGTPMSPLPPDRLLFGRFASSSESMNSETLPSDESLSSVESKADFNQLSRLEG